MTAVPTCPVHGVGMAQSKNGPGFYCTQKVGVGQPGANARGYCTQRYVPPQQTVQPVSAGSPPQIGTIAPSWSGTTSPTPASNTEADAALAGVCLQFAKDLYVLDPESFRNGSEDPTNNVINIAARAYNAMKAVMR
jgi:hypothetical protein